MVDEEIKDVSAGPTGAPVNRDARREPEVIEGEIAGRETDDSKSSPDPTAAETSADAPAPPERLRAMALAVSWRARWVDSSSPRSALAPAIRF